MPRAAWVVWGCVVLAGCQTTKQPRLPPPPPPPEKIRLIQTVITADDDSIKQVVIAHVPPGTPVAQAQMVLEFHGFECRPYTRLAACFNRASLIPPGVNLVHLEKRLIQEAEKQPLCCQMSRDLLGKWGKKSLRVLVALFPDAAQNVQDVEVVLGPTTRHPYYEYFAQQLDSLQEPVGLPADQAGVKMEAAGFHFVASEGGGPGQKGRRFLLFEAFNEWPFGGWVARVRLYPDESGVIRETEVLSQGEWFEGEYCMLPRANEPPAWFVCKAALYPVRLGCRYTLYGVLYTSAMMLFCMSHGQCR